MSLPSTINGAPPVRVLVADRQPLFREAAARAVRQCAQFRLVGEAGDGRSALRLLRVEHPDVAIVDVRLPGIDGRRVLNAAVRDGLASRILLISAADDAASSYAAIEAGAGGWLSRTVDAGELCTAIAAAARGEVALGRDAHTLIAGEIRRRAASERDAILTERERQVLIFVADGLGAREIGERLHLSTGTVKSCLLQIYRRFEVSERAAAVAVALRRGLIE
ncbi:response regulator transcription factor [Conexibacter stalactiti]|uniref:Response regulator transcription factor n=1 Tax=Conexibacter stalactiti TaxID=1940611 RepID=A0ABU4HJ78_9ACTN|nr:response regulator transcription factor [Conexibacter stalactiti]MDW5593366.1 response regulator transcription factor [Conexibacter stalactiti]MEC5034007.1 response regulator transcription factor [Conexibacter stalactiti]